MFALALKMAENDVLRRPAVVGLHPGQVTATEGTFLPLTMSEMRPMDVKPPFVSMRDRRRTWSAAAGSGVVPFRNTQKWNEMPVDEGVVSGIEVELYTEATPGTIMTPPAGKLAGQPRGDPTMALGTAPEPEMLVSVKYAVVLFVPV